MKKLPVLTLLAALLAPLAAQAELKLTSNTFANGATLGPSMEFNGFGCTGDNISPQLSWTGVPAGTKALALNMYDPDAPTGSGWWHWVVFNLPPTLESLPSGAGEASGTLLPAGSVQSVTDYGKPGYGGMCPPAGDKPHRYIITLFALKDVVPLDAKASGALVGYYLNSLALEKAQIMGLFGRPAQ